MSGSAPIAHPHGHIQVCFLLSGMALLAGLGLLVVQQYDVFGSQLKATKVHLQGLGRVVPLGVTQHRPHTVRPPPVLKLGSPSRARARHRKHARDANEGKEQKVPKEVQKTTASQVEGDSERGNTKQGTGQEAVTSIWVRPGATRVQVFEVDAEDSRGGAVFFSPPSVASLVDNPPKVKTFKSPLPVSTVSALNYMDTIDEVNPRRSKPAQLSGPEFETSDEAEFSLANPEGQITQKKIVQVAKLGGYGLFCGAVGFALGLLWSQVTVTSGAATASAEALVDAAREAASTAAKEAASTEALNTMVTGSMVATEAVQEAGGAIIRSGFLLSSWAVELIAGCSALIFASILLYPLDTMKTRVQCDKSPTSTNGFLALYRGYFWSVIQDSLSVAVVISSTLIMDALLSTQPFFKQRQYLAFLAAGAVGSILSAIVRGPLELVTKQRQTMTAKGSRVALKQTLLSPTGWSQAIAAVFVVALRDLPHSVLQLAIFESLRTYVWTPILWGSLLLVERLCIGVFSEMVASLFSNPLDMLATQTMTSMHIAPQYSFATATAAAPSRSLATVDTVTFDTSDPDHLSMACDKDIHDYDLSDEDEDDVDLDSPKEVMLALRDHKGPVAFGWILLVIRGNFQNIWKRGISFFWSGWRLRIQHRALHLLVTCLVYATLKALLVVGM